MKLQLSVDYYNTGEKELFESYPNFKEIEKIVNNKCFITKAELETYMLFTEQANQEGWRTYDELKLRVPKRLGDIEDRMDYSNGSIQTKQSASRMHDAGMTERIGVSLGLNAVNQIHGLTEADWAITEDVVINGKQAKDFDYELLLGSDGEKFIQVENKGSILDDNTKKDPKISKHFKSIKEKKADILNRNTTNNKNIYYGTIGALDDTNVAKVWLVDPPSFEVDWDPVKFRLVSRLSFYCQLFIQVGVHKRIFEALERRIKEIRSNEDFKSLDKKRLDIGKSERTYISGSRDFIRINQTEAFGSFFYMENTNQLFIIAVTKAIIKLVINQDFDRILNYNYKNAELTDNATIEFKAKDIPSELDFNSDGVGYRLPPPVNFVFDKKKKKYIARHHGKIGFTSSGRVFGVVG